MKNFSEIPVVDLKFCDSITPPTDEDILRSISQALDAGLVSHGCAYLANHGVPDEIFQNVFEKSSHFFHLPASEKNLYQKSGKKFADYGGYYVSSRQQVRERYDFMFQTEIVKNKTPELIQHAFSQYRSHLNTVAGFLFNRIETALDLEKDSLLNAHRGALFQDPDVETRAHISSLFYGKLNPDDVEQEPETLIMDEHTDFTSITLITTSAPGIQVKGEFDGNWINVSPKSGTIFLHVGDILERWSGGRYPATVHRVKYYENICGNRQSIPYFLHPDVHAKVEPLIPIAPGWGSYPAITAGDYWILKMREKQIKLNN